jgi:hypothetical protein
LSGNASRRQQPSNLMIQELALLGFAQNSNLDEAVLFDIGAYESDVIYRNGFD